MNICEKQSLHRQQKNLGYMFLLLPVLSVGLGMIGYLRGVNEPLWYQSISATYYANSRIMMIGIIFALSLNLWTYHGYDRIDDIISSISSVAAIGVLIFPCSDIGATSEEIVGLFCLPLSVSGKIHLIFAAVLFCSFFLQVMRFTKHGSAMTGEKNRRNKAYCICIAVMMVGVLFILSHSIIECLKDLHHFMFIGECFLMAGYGAAWLIKAGSISFLNDKPLNH